MEAIFFIIIIFLFFFHFLNWAYIKGESRKNGFTRQEQRLFEEYKKFICEKYDIEYGLIDDRKVYKNFLELLDEI